ncbi:MAG TPA: hypothetical protein VHC96_16245 [Puia sp.]|jgi:hypothetical protein|nr:hypothetical protein [Puia sp.]
MEFQAPTVQDKKNPKARISAIGAILLVAAVFLAMVDGYEKYAMWTFGAAVLIFLVGVILAKADLTDIEVSNIIVLVVSSEGIRIGGRFFPMGQVQNIDFNIKGYAGMYVPDRAIVSTESDGMENYLRFEYMGQAEECRFYLHNAQHVQQLGLLFQRFQQELIPFVSNLT